MKTSLFRGLLASIILSVTVLSFGQALPPVEIAPGVPAYAPGELIIQFKPEVTDEHIANAFSAGRLSLIQHVRTPAMEDHGQIGLTHVSTALPVLQAVRGLSHLPGVEFAEPNWIARSQAESNDPLYLDGSLWGMFGDDYPSPVGPAATTNPFGSQAEKAWAAGMIGSSSVAVGVIDEGIQYDHPDLAPNIWTNPSELSGNLIDEDGNGYVDDVHGWNAIADNGITFDPGYDDHGTHVAGTIGAAGGNGIGVAGVNWNVTLISGKFLGRNNSGSYLDAIQAIDYIVSLKVRKGLNIVALNHSWGGTGFSQALLDAIGRAAQAGILSVVAAMNNATNIDVAPCYPATYDTTPIAGYNAVIAVASTTRYGEKRITSNWGPTKVHLGAPGEDILSTIPPGTYGLKSGTSMATPHVTGAIALYVSTHPGATPQQIRNDLLTAGVRPLAALQGITVTGGLLDIGALMAVPPIGLPAPAAPSNVRLVVVSGGRVDVSWTDQSSDELGFAIERSTDGQTFVSADTVGANLVSYSDRTVRPSTTYFYRVRAYNPGGSSGYVYAQAPVTTPYVALPAAPTSLTATAQAAGRGGGVALAWKDKSNNEDGFQIERKTGSTGLWQLLSVVSANTVKYTDLSTVSSTTYSYRVRAYNAAGTSAYSNEVSATAK